MNIDQKVISNRHTVMNINPAKQANEPVKYMLNG